VNSETKGVTIWLTGLSGSGKTSIAIFLEQQLVSLGYKTEVLDGDVVRQYLAGDLGYSKKDRDENIRRIGFVSHLLTRNNVFVIVAAISPYRDIRQEVREKPAPHSPQPPSGCVSQIARGPLTSLSGTRASRHPSPPQ
jgi:adenylylsulfate kinase